MGSRHECGAGGLEVCVRNARAETRPRLHQNDVPAILAELTDRLRRRSDARFALPDLGRYPDSHMEGGFLYGGKLHASARFLSRSARAADSVWPPPGRSRRKDAV